MAEGAKASVVPSNAILLAGPTAVGKSEVGMLLAEALEGEIISVDSMQVYRGLDIGTAKPDLYERNRVRHHLIDVVDVTEPFDAAHFIRLANTALEDIRSRGKVPILCGGTGLYFQALLGGLGQAPPSDAVLRAELEATPTEKLLEELSAHDPPTHAAIDQANRRRVVRAIEVMRLTGKPFSALRSDWTRESVQDTKRSFLLTRSSSDLQFRVNTRVGAMFQKGLVVETEELLRRGLAENRTASQALGYRQVIEHLRGNRSLSETIELVKIRTRQFAKRQMTWFCKHGQWTCSKSEPTDSAQIIANR